MFLIGVKHEQIESKMRIMLKYNNGKKRTAAKWIHEKKSLRYDSRKKGMLDVEIENQIQ